jgi:hypothetical protein
VSPEQLRKLAGGALAVSAFSIALALAAFWRAGGDRGAERLYADLRADLDGLHSRQTELAEHARTAVEERYAAARDRMARLHAAITAEREAAEAGLRAQLDHAAGHAEALLAAVEEAGRSARDGTIVAAEELQRSLLLRVRAAEGRLALLQAKRETQRAQRLAEAQRFEAAVQALEAASEHVNAAQEKLPRQHDPAVAVLRSALRAATEAVESRALDSRERLDDTLKTTDSLVTALEQAEDAAAGRVGPSGRRSS